jgi:hypothetical protein
MKTFHTESSNDTMASALDLKRLNNDEEFLMVDLSQFSNIR